MEPLPVTDDLRKLWADFATEETGADRQTALQALALVTEISDEGRAVFDPGEAEKVNPPPDWINAFCLPLFAMVVFEVVKTAVHKGWKKARELRPDEFQRRLAKSKDGEAAARALRFVQQREHELTKYLEGLGRHTPAQEEIGRQKKATPGKHERRKRGRE